MSQYSDFKVHLVNDRTQHMAQLTWLRLGEGIALIHLIYVHTFLPPPTNTGAGPAIILQMA